MNNFSLSIVDWIIIIFFMAVPLVGSGGMVVVNLVKSPGAIFKGKFTEGIVHLIAAVIAAVICSGLGLIVYWMGTSTDIDVLNIAFSLLMIFLFGTSVLGMGFGAVALMFGGVTKLLNADLTGLWHIFLSIVMAFFFVICAWFLLPRF